MKQVLFILISSFYSLSFCIEHKWLENSSSEIFIPSPQDKKSECPKYYNKINISEIDHPVRDVHHVDFSGITEISDDLDKTTILNAIDKNIEYIISKPENFKTKLGSDIYTKEQILKTLKRLKEIFQENILNQNLLDILKNEFKIYKAAADDGSNTVTITGYYEAEIEVLPQKDGEYSYPLHLRPNDLIKTTPEMGVDFDYGRYDENGKLVRYYTTAEIRNGIIDNKKLEISYSAHPSHIMLAQIQGSAILRYPDGNFLKIGFDGANGWPFKSVQKILMDCGEIPSMSFKDFIKYLSSQPRERELELVNLNPRYIFFKIKPKDSLPYGAIGHPLTAHRSIAIDPQYIPLGFIGYLKSQKPIADENGNILGFEKFSRFVATQDTGSAIRGPGRIDLFWGNGKKAEAESSSMKAEGEFYLFILK